MIGQIKQHQNNTKREIFLSRHTYFFDWRSFVGHGAPSCDAWGLDDDDEPLLLPWITIPNVLLLSDFYVFKTSSRQLITYLERIINNSLVGVKIHE